MSDKIIKKYKKLYESCQKYPPIILSGRWGRKPKPHKEQKNYAKDGFIEMFCTEKGEDNY